MKLRLIQLLLILSFAQISKPLLSQSRLGIGLNVEPLLCFTDLNPRLDGLQKTSPRHWDLFNYKLGLHADYQMEKRLCLTTGMDLSRKRYGFIHEGTISEQAVRLWGHSEYYSISLPLTLSYIIVANSDPFFELSPFVGISVGKDISSYRNLSRLDDNSSYMYRFDNSDYERVTSLAAARIGIEFRTIIDQLGLFYWSFTLGTDLTSLAGFNYEIISSEGSASFEQSIRMNYVSLGMTHYFTTWEIFNGRFMRRRYD